MDKNTYSPMQWVELRTKADRNGNSRKVFIQVLDGITYAVMPDDFREFKTLSAVHFQIVPSEYATMRRYAEGQRRDGVRIKDHGNEQAQKASFKLGSKAKQVND